MKSSMPPQAEILTLTVDDFRAQHAEEVAHDVFLQAEQILRSLGDSGGGRALARLIKALHGEGGLKFNDLLPWTVGTARLRWRSSRNSWMSAVHLMSGSHWPNWLIVAYFMGCSAMKRVS